VTSSPPARPRPRNLASFLWILPLAPLGLAIAQVQKAPLIAPKHDLTADQAAKVGDAIRAREPAMYRESVERFPGDDWSQGDHFGNQERSFVRDQSALLNARPGAVLRAIAEDLRREARPSTGAAQAGNPRGTAPPCMPRPFYD
jgi:hypothetical protein